MQDSKIEWTDHTFNPWVGCQAVSPACDNCYAERTAKRLKVKWGPGQDRRLTGASTWAQPRAWNMRAAVAQQPTRVFSASLADWLDNAVPIEWLVDFLGVVRATPSLTWLLLTKRPQLLRRRLHEAHSDAEAQGRAAVAQWIAAWLDGQAPGNVALGTTVENQTEADRRIPLLLSIAARLHFLSCEPLLGPVDLSKARNGRNALLTPHLDGTRIGWVIAGGESGPNARASHPAWFRGLRDQCQAAGVPFFFKQWGEWAPADPKDQSAPFPNGWRALAGHPHVARREELYPETGAVFVARWGKAAAGALLDGREWREVPAL